MIPDFHEANKPKEAASPAKVAEAPKPPPAPQPAPVPIPVPVPIKPAGYFHLDHNVAAEQIRHFQALNRANRDKIHGSK